MKKSRIEKLLWILVLLSCLLAVVCAWLGRFFNPIEKYYQMSVILSLFTLAINGVSFFYFNKELHRQSHPVFAPTLALLALYTCIIMIQYLGIFQIGLLSEDTKTLWMGVPVLSMIWETRLIWGSIEFGKRDQTNKKTGKKTGKS